MEQWHFPAFYLVQITLMRSLQQRKQINAHAGARRLSGSVHFFHFLLSKQWLSFGSFLLALALWYFWYSFPIRRCSINVRVQLSCLLFVAMLLCTESCNDIVTTNWLNKPFSNADKTHSIFMMQNSARAATKTTMLSFQFSSDQLLLFNMFGIWWTKKTTTTTLIKWHRYITITALCLVRTNRLKRNFNVISAHFN